MDSQQLLYEADRISKGKGLTQAEWCRQAGFDQFGKLISNALNRGDCKLKVFLQLLKPLGYQVNIVRIPEKRERKTS